ncbi:MAG: hypothetical protein ABH845_00350, partial [Candidatus Omnitrophota bacterium]
MRDSPEKSGRSWFVARLGVLGNYSPKGNPIYRGCKPVPWKFRLVGIYDEDKDNVSFPDTMMRLPVNEKVVTKPFLEIVLQSRRGRLHMMKAAAGTSGSMKKINRKTLGSCLISTPSLNDQIKFLG